MIEILDGRRLSQEEVREVEQDLGVSLPDDYREFAANHDGVRPPLNIFPIADANESGVNEFIPLRRVQKECAFIENLSDDRILRLRASFAMIGINHEQQVHHQTR